MNGSRLKRKAGLAGFGFDFVRCFLHGLLSHSHSPGYDKPKLSQLDNSHAVRRRSIVCRDRSSSAVDNNTEGQQRERDMNMRYDGLIKEGEDLAGIVQCLECLEGGQFFWPLRKYAL